MRHPRLLAVVLVLSSLGVAAALAGRAGADGEEAQPGGSRDEALLPSRPIDGAGAGYVGAAACRACHTEEHAAWTRSSHARTFLPVTAENAPAEIVPGETVAHPPGTSTFHAEDGQITVTTQGDEGAITVPLTHVVGRMRVRMYVGTMDDGRMQVLPGMYAVPSGTWFDYTQLLFGGRGTDWTTPPVVEPGDGSFWTGPARAWDARCARCHTSGRRQERPEPGEIGTRSTQRTLGVDCEMCHGPGAAHVVHHEAERPPDEDPIMRYADLARERQVSVCLRCHMESDVVDADFHVGEDVFEHVTPTLMLEPDRIDPYGRVLELIYDGLPFSASRCAQEGGLTCVSCHDPHGSGHPSQLTTAPDDDRLCTRCHDTIGADPEAHTHHDPTGPGGRCVACHMPFLEIERGHGVVADHSISVPRLDLPGDRVAQDACTWCHTGGLWAPDAVPTLESAAIREGYARFWPDAAPAAPWMRALAAGRTEAKGAPAALAAVARDAAQYRVVRASATRLLGRYAENVPLVLMLLATDEDSLVRRSAMTALAALEGEAVNRLLLRGLADPASGVRVAAARAAVEGFGRIQEDATLRAAAIPVLREDVETAPMFEDRWFRLGAALQIEGDLEGALAAYERYVALDPTATAVKTQIERLRERLGR